MPEAKLDNQGAIPLTPEVLKALGWEPGQELHIQVQGDQLLVHPAAPTASIKDEARRLASSMRDLATGAGRQIVETVGALSARAAEAVPPAAPAPRLGAFQGVTPRVAPTVYLAPNSTVAGDVTLGEDVSVWPGVSIRGDVAPVRVGARTNIQDGAVLHVSPQQACSVGAGVTIGHQATVHACTVGDDTLIGIQSVVLDGAVIGRHCIIAAGAVVPPGMQVPDRSMVMGVPGKIVRELTPQEIERVHWNSDTYVSLKNQYLNPSPAPAPVPIPEPPVRTDPPKRGSLPRHECRRAAGKIVVDGSLDDAGWQGIAPLSAMLHSHGDGHPGQATEVRVCWDDNNLYLAFSCKDTDIWGNFEERDDPIYDEEVVEFFLCPTGDLRHYFEFEVSPLNVIFDAKVFNPDGDRATMLVDRSWDAGGLRTAVRVSGVLNDHSAPDIGWIAEAALPFQSLGLSGPPAPGSVWRANFYRIERGQETEYSAWSPTFKEPPDFHVPACFGELVFV